MGYSPTLGRFLERDPIGSLNFRSSSEQAPIVKQAIKSAQDSTASRSGHKNDWWLWEYADGMNSYQFVGSSPDNNTDPSGLDRYIVGPEPHNGIAVDTWAFVGGKYVRTGTVQYDFAADYRQGPLIIGGIVFSCSGRVTFSPIMTGTVVQTIPSSPQADMTLKGTLDAAVIDPPNYHLIFYSCRTFCEVHAREGMPPLPPATKQEIDEIRRRTIPTGF